MAEAFRPRCHLQVEAFTKSALIAVSKTPELEKLGAWELVADALLKRRLLDRSRTGLSCQCFPRRSREIMLFIGKPKGRSEMISNATNPSQESRKESLLMCAGSTSICVWLVCEAVGDRALGDLCVCVRCGSVQSQKYESVVIGLDIRVEVVSEEQKASRLCCWLTINSMCARLGCMRVPLVEDTPQ